MYCLTACTNDETVIEDQNIEYSEAITTSLFELKSKFDSEGFVIPDKNPTGNIVFDFCFDFVYPINLSYNNGATVAVNDLEGLIDILVSSTNVLFIDGVAFPFDVELFNNNSKSIDIETINNEQEFVEILGRCDFDNTTVCPEVYDPVCVEVTDPNGVPFTITYMNVCFALSDGFTEPDFIGICYNDYYAAGLFECFTLNFPVELITEGDSIITVNSEAQFYNAIYNMYTFNFVYPFIITNSVGDAITINNEMDFETVLEDCYYSFPCYDLFDPVCVVVTDANGQASIVTYDNECLALLEGFTPNDFVDCDTNDCTEEVIVSILTACPWAFYLNETIDYIYTFNVDRTFDVSFDGENITSGTWSLGIANNFVYMLLNANEPMFNDEWELSDCDEQSFDVISLEFPDRDVRPTCDDDYNPTECTAEDVELLVTECDFWTADIDGLSYKYIFSYIGTVEVFSIDNESIITTGTWSLDIYGDGLVGVYVDTESGIFRSTWLFSDCQNPNGPSVEGLESQITNITGCY